MKTVELINGEENLFFEKINNRDSPLRNMIKKTRKAKSVPGDVLNMQSFRIYLTKTLFKFSGLQSTRVEKGNK